MLAVLIGLIFSLSAEAKDLKLDGGGRAHDMCTYTQDLNCFLKVKARAEYDAQRDTETICEQAKGRLMYETLRNVARCTPNMLQPWMTMQTLVECEAKSYATCELPQPEKQK